MATLDDEERSRRKERKVKTEKSKRSKSRDKAKEEKHKRRLRPIGERDSTNIVDDPSGRRGVEDPVGEKKGFTQENIYNLPSIDASAQDDSEVLEAVNTSFLGSRDTDSADLLEVKLYVEHETSGEFFRLRPRSKKKSILRSDRNLLRRLHKGRQRHNDKGDTEGGEHDIIYCFRGVQSSVLRDAEAALMMVCHGIVVGVSWMDAFNLGASHDQFRADPTVHTRFTCTYSGLSDRSRQLFFLMFNLSLLGLMRQISRLRQQIHKEDDRVLHRFHTRSMRFLQGGFVLTIIALLVLLVGSPSAMRLTHAYTNNPSWCNDLADHAMLTGSTLAAANALTRQQQCAIINAVLLSIAWLLLCIQWTMGRSSHMNLLRRLNEAHSTIDQLEQRAEHLEASHLDDLSIDALKDLIQLHQRAIESTERMLVTKIQLQNPTAFAPTSAWRSST